MTRRPRSWPCSESSSTETSAPAVSRSTIASQSRKSASSSTAPSSCRTDCTLIVLLGRRRELVERRLGVAERASRAARDQRQRRVRRLDPLAVADAPQHAHELLQPRPREDERLAARAHGRQHLGEVGGAEDEDEVGRRLLDQLQQRVPGGVGELVRLVEDVDLVAALGGLEHDALADLADVVDAALRGGVHLDHVERGAVRDRDADVADVVGRRRRALLAVERLREDARHRGLARAARAGEEVRLAHLPELDRVPQRPHDRLLADDLVEVLRPVLAVERGHSSILIECMPGRALRLRSASPGGARVAGSGQADRGTWEGILSAASFRT